MRARYWLIVVVVLVLPTVFLITWNSLANSASGTWSYSQLIQQAGARRVSAVAISGSTARATDVQGRTWTVQMPANDGPALRTLIADGVDVAVRQSATPGGRLLPALAVTGLVLVAGIAGFALGRAGRGSHL